MLIQFVILSSSISFAFEKISTSKTNDVQSLLDTMTLEEKIGQLFVFGFKDKELTSSLKKFLINYKPGGLIFFSRNGKSPAKVQSLIKDIKAFYKEIGKIEPFFVVDHEGGEVVRVGPPHFFPSALSLGQTKDPAISYDLGKWTGRYLKNIGFDINLAPVVDLRSEKAVNFIGERSFSSLPKEVIDIVSPFIAGTRSAGVLSVLKHFPGHGRLQEDSHFEKVRKISNLDELNKKDLLPFKKIIHQHPNTGVMTSHMAVPALDPTGTLTTFSKPIVSKLANEYQHEGLVFSDDLDMLFFKDKKINVGMKSIEALKAGHDQILIVWSNYNKLNSLKYLKKSLDSDNLSINFIDDKVKKVLTSKLRLKEERELNYASVLKSLSKIYSLQNQINYLHFNKISKPLIKEISNSIKSDKAIYLFSYSYYFYKSFKTSFDSGRYIPLSQSYWSSSINKCTNNLCFFHVSGDQSAKLLSEIPKDVLKKLIVINTSDPAVTEKLSEKTLNLYSTSTKFWKWFAKEIEKTNSSDDYAQSMF